VQYLKLGRSGLDVSPIAIGATTHGEPMTRKSPGSGPRSRG
jgi:aryl-alcohol dehydrogenase-like predicted oxidoreductase